MRKEGLNPLKVCLSIKIMLIYANLFIMMSIYHNLCQYLGIQRFEAIKSVINYHNYINLYYFSSIS